MKLVINYIFRSGFGVKRAITTVIGGYVSPELDLHHHFIPKEINQRMQKPVNISGNSITAVRNFVWR